MLMYVYAVSRISCVCLMSTKYHTCYMFASFVHLPHAIVSDTFTSVYTVTCIHKCYVILRIQVLAHI